MLLFDDKYSKPIRSTIFNFNKLVADFNFDILRLMRLQKLKILLSTRRSYYYSNLKIISDSRICSIISKDITSYIDFNKCREEIAASLAIVPTRKC